MATPKAKVKLDTHNEFKTYTEGGFTEQQAEALLDVQVNSIENYLANKNDIGRLETRIGTEVSRLETRIETEVSRLETRIETEASRLEDKISRLEARIETEVSRLEDKIEAQGNEIKATVELLLQQTKTELIKWTFGLLTGHTVLLFMLMSFFFER